MMNDTPTARAMHDSRTTLRGVQITKAVGHTIYGITALSVPALGDRPRYIAWSAMLEEEGVSFHPAEGQRWQLAGIECDPEPLAWVDLRLDLWEAKAEEKVRRFVRSLAV